MPQVVTSEVELRAARPIEQAHTTLADLVHQHITLHDAAPVLGRWTWAGSRERRRIRSTIGDIEWPSSIRVMRSDPLVMLGQVSFGSCSSRRMTCEFENYSCLVAKGLGSARPWSYHPPRPASRRRGSSP